MRSQYRPMIIMSTDRLELPHHVNAENRAMFSSSLYNLGITTMYSHGEFLGQPEKGFVFEDTPKNRAIALQAMEQFNQECILTIDNEGFGILVYPDNREVRIGRLKVYDKKPQGDYTYVNGNFFNFV